MCRDTFVRRVAELEALVDVASVEHFSLATDEGRSITDVALDLLSLAKWIA